MNVLSLEKKTQIIGALTEGVSLRSVARLTDTNRETVGTLALTVGQACERLHDRMMVELNVNLLQLDEQWDFIGKKQKRVRQDDPKEMGDVWLYVALSATHKAVLSYVIGKRTPENTEALALDLRARILNRPQITSDGYAPYVGAITMAFDQSGVDFAVLTKKYVSDSNLPDAAHRYSPGHVSGVEKAVIRGNPDPEHISTSYVERFNLSTRMASRRFTRLSNGYSKRLENHRAAVALWIAYYNFCRVHETLRCTPAMALGVTDHIWSIAELLTEALGTPEMPKPGPQTPPTTIRPGYRPFRPFVIHGGKMRPKRER
ncbi:MAG: transposase [Candidatus Binataceae bacterium]|jgi:IS1 family transposase